MKPFFYRPQVFAENIVVVDGMSATGKSLISPILSTLSRVQLWQICEWYEYLCVTRRLEGLSRNASNSLIQTFADLDLYNILIARRANFRNSDLTGVTSNLLLKEYQKRAAGPEGDVVVKKARKDEPILNLMTHYVFGSCDIFFDAWMKRLKLVILPVRHPLWLVDKWRDGQWDKRMGLDPRDVQLCCKANGKTVPWFAASWAARYIKLKPLEQAIAVVDWFTRDFNRQYAKLTADRKKRVLIVPFEDFAFKPDFYIQQFCDRLGVRTTPLTRAMLTKMKLPRKNITADYTELSNKITAAARREKTGGGSMAVFKKMCAQYEKDYPQCLSV